MNELFPTTGASAMAASLAAAVVVVLVGTGVMLYERFSRAGLRLALLTGILGCAVVLFGLEAASGQHAELWLRLALATDALLAPAVYALALALVQVERPRVVRLAWAAGIGLCAWSLATPTLAAGTVAVAETRFITDGAWAGTLIVAFMLTLLTATVYELVHSYRSADHPDDRNRALTLAAGFAIGSIGLVDFFMDPRIFDGAGASPLAVTVAVLTLGYAAVRFRAFSPQPWWAAEQILQVMADGVLLCDSAGHVRSANRAARGLLGVSERELSGTLLRDILRVPASPHATGPDPRSAAAGRPAAPAFTPPLDEQVRDLDSLLLRSNGDPVEVSLSSEPLRQHGRLVGWVIVLRDSRDRLRAARALRATEQRYHSLFWNNPALAYEVDPAGGLIQANPALQCLIASDGRPLAGRNFSEFLHHEDIAAATQVFQRVLSGRAEAYQFRLVVPGGAALRVKGVSIPVVRDGAVVAVFGVALDITEEERVRSELELQRLEFAELFEGSPEAILVADEDDVIIRVNPEFTHTFGYPAAEAVGRRVDDLLVPTDLRDEGASLTLAARCGDVVRAEAVRRRRDGSLIDVSVLARELRLPGRPPQLYGIYRDVTDRKRAEQSLRERDDELRHAQRLESIGKLAGGVAHDFNNLVTVINGHVGFALELLPPDHPARRDLEQIGHAGSRAANLTQQLLAFSRRQLLRPETVDAAAVIADVRRMLGRIIGEHIRFETAHEGAALVRADRGQLEQLLVNLVVNARDAMPDGGRLTIATDRVELRAGDAGIEDWEVQPGQYIRISVTDTGVGMDEATLARAFDPFFTTKEQGKGTGLGLATVFGIAKQSGGHVTASSTPGRGTTVRVWLPIARGEVGRPTTDSADTPGAAPAPTPAAADGARVLVVEDEDALRELAARVLRRAGYDVLLAADGVDAIAILERTPLDLVVSDLVMPRMGGRELSRRLRLTHPDVPIVLMSGYEDETVGDATGHAILSKPFTPAQLVRRVADALGADCVA